MRQLATIRQIATLRPIEGADRIEVAQVDGWECVVKKGEFQVGEKIVYIEIDSIVPERPEFEFLRDRKFRVRTIKLKGQISQGLVLALSILPEGTSTEVGTDVTEVLGIKKYDPEAQQEAKLLASRPTKKKNFIERFFMRFAWYRKLFAKSRRKGEFPEWIAKTDETRIQNLPILFETERDNKTEFSVTEKVDGQSATYFLHKVSKRKYEFGVCSRNIRLTTPDESSYWTVAKQYNIESALRTLRVVIGDGNSENIVLQGEICGSQIQGNKYRINGYEFFAFNLIVDGKKYSTADMQTLLEPLEIQTVPILEEGKTLPETISELVDYAKGNSVVRREQKREGVVMRNSKRNVSFKVISPEFLLAEKDHGTEQ